MNSKEPEIEKHYQKQAEEFVDMLFDTGIMNPEIKRKDRRALEDYVAYMYQSHANSNMTFLKFEKQISHLLERLLSYDQ